MSETKEDLKSAKKTLGKVFAEDTFELASIYAQLEFLLEDLKKIPPSAAEVEAMAVTIFIDRRKSGGSFSGGGGGGKKGGGRGKGGGAGSKKPDPVDCPDCGREEVEPLYSQNKRVWYFRCPECDVFINKDGTTTAPRGG